MLNHIFCIKHLDKVISTFIAYFAAVFLSMLQIIINSLTSFSLLLLLGASISLIYGASRFIDASLAGVVTYCCYSLYIFHSLHFSLVTAITLSLASSICLAILMHHYLFRRLMSTDNAGMNALLASLGVYLILQNVLAASFGNDVKIVSNGMVETGHDFFGAYTTNIQLATMLVSILCFVSLLLLLRYTWLGLVIRALSSNVELCQLLGIRTQRIALRTIAIGISLGSVAAILSALDTGMTPNMGFRLLMNGLIVMVIGGVGSIRGLLGGALLLATAQTLTSYYLDSKWMDAISFVILIVFLIWKPLGFSGRRLKKVEI